MKTEPFNPLNKKHQKGLMVWLKKMQKEYQKNPPPILVIDKKLLNALKEGKWKINIKI